MIDGTRVELVVASFDDPIVTALQVEQEAEVAARFGAAAGGSPAEPGTVFFVARDRGGPLGCAGLRWIGTDAAEVGHLFVRREHRGAGVTRTLLAAAEDLARDRGCRVARVRVADLREARPYEASGYVRVLVPGPPAVGRTACFEKALHGPPRTGRRDAPPDT